MFEWIFLLFTPAVPYAAPAPTEDFVGVVAAEAAYTTLLPSAPNPDTPAPQPIDPNCPTCKGKGKVPSGDGHEWTKCPTCQAFAEEAPPVAQPEAQPAAAKPRAAQTTPGWPPKPRNDCPDGNCPIPASGAVVRPSVSVPR